MWSVYQIWVQTIVNVLSCQSTWQRHYIVDTKMHIEEREPKKGIFAAVQALIRADLMLLETRRSLFLRQLKLFRFLSLNVYYKSAKCIHIWCVVILSVSFSNSVFWCHLKMARGVFWRLAKKKKTKPTNLLSFPRQVLLWSLGNQFGWVIANPLRKWEYTGYNSSI